MPKDDLKAQREALKADILRMKGGKKSTATAQSEASEESSEEDALANTNQSHFTVNLSKYKSILKGISLTRAFVHFL